MDLIKPLDPYTLSPVDEPWRNRAAGVKGHAAVHENWTAPQAEIVKVIAEAGLVPDPEDLTQLWQAIRGMIDGKLGLRDDGDPLFLRVSNAGQTPQSVAPTASVLCTNMVKVGGNAPEGAWTGSRFVVTEDLAGSYGVYNRLNINNEQGEGSETWVNGAKVDSYQINSTAGTSNVVGFTHFVFLRAGDYLEFYHRHLSSGPLNNDGSYATLYRFLKI